ncbi:MAG: dihydroneopterin aldolase [Chitinophagaceae bacterium]|nr:dihydroneopterin aldolase [Chitinophagaceae bacterium]MCW5905934.1 dihydroneopterin aldolase [Chitinophagaceae bacterium]
MFHSYHGLYEEEKILGNEFEVNITLLQHTVAETITNIQQCTNYAAVYALVEQRMKQATPLLETVAQDICKLILQNFSLVDVVSISIKKIYPPMVKMQGSVSIHFELKRS